MEKKTPVGEENFFFLKPKKNYSDQSIDCLTTQKHTNNKGIKAVETTLKRKRFATRIITGFLHLVLTLNSSICQNYLQIKGCTMGPKCAPSYANIFMGVLDEKFIYPLVNNMTRLYLRFIDHIFIIWTGTLCQLFEFRQQTNEVHPSIAVEFKFSNKVTNFSGTVVYKTPTGIIYEGYRPTNLFTPQTRTS